MVNQDGIDGEVSEDLLLTECGDICNVVEGNEGAELIWECCGH